MRPQKIDCIVRITFEKLKKTLNKILQYLPSFKRSTRPFQSKLTEMLALTILSLPVLAVLIISSAHTASASASITGPLLLSIILPTFALGSVIAVPTLKHPVHSLLALLGTFAAMAIIYLRAGAEYLSLVFLIVYVGALAILFLFVIMLLNANEIAKKRLAEVYSITGYALAYLAGALVFDSLRYAVLRGLEKHFSASQDAPTELQLFGARLHTDILALQGLYGTD